MLFKSGKEKQNKITDRRKQTEIRIGRCTIQCCMNIQAELAANATPVASNTTTITGCEKIKKLPEMVILKFNGSCIRPDFGDNSEAVDKITITPISNFTYLYVNGSSPM